MKVADVIAHILKAEGVEILFAYPVNPLIEAAAKLDIRPIIVRQERTGLHMADAFSRVTSGQRIGVFCMQSGPGAENAFGGVAQAYGDSVPIVVLPMGYKRSLTNVQPNFNSFLNFQHVTKSCEQVVLPQAVPDAMRRAFSQVRSGRPRPTMVEIPSDLFDEEVPGDFQYRPTTTLRSAPDPEAVERVAEVLLAAERPVIYAGQGVHYAQGWQALQALAELLEAPVTTTLNGKSAFPEGHPLSLGCAGRTLPRTAYDFLQNADVIFGIGCSFTITNFGVHIPQGKTIIHATLDPADINKDVASEYALVGDARLTLEALAAAVGARLGGQPRNRKAGVVQQVRQGKVAWLDQWMGRLTSNETPLSPYRVIWDLLQTVDVANTIITHDAGSPRDQLSPFWESITPLSYSTVVFWQVTGVKSCSYGYPMLGK
ncbi:MAG: thiamine pyrophosphate-requiring protein [Chloroflexi bacterium]|nr:thiamine pyrophosphate-requiring protein [Chloroflexota bacterium]